MRVAIVAIGDSGEARLIRDLLEAQGHEVRLAHAGKPSDVFAGLDFFGTPADAAILSAHGDEKGIVFPEMAAGVDTLVLRDDRLTPAIFHAHLRAAPKLVLSTACDTGGDAFASAFLDAGANSYAAPVDYPEGADIAIWLAVFFRALADSDAEAALARANAAVSAESAFRLAAAISF